MYTSISLDTFTNPVIPISDPNVWENYGIGDPFVMRWCGRYYLYCSTRDGELGIQCWISDDLDTWRYNGLCATEKLTVTAYAPEVVYYNGYFYMYTSPAGNGHYVLRSQSPTGPFTAVTGNFGHSIDGSVFIDDDGKWYFYSADFSGIKVYAMTAPDRISDVGSGTGAYMNGWTEGPMVVKVNGTYYLTYTGNHVWCRGYRINYATSQATPTEFTEGTNNPILLNTLGELRGIGHSSTVMGPNMDSHYIVYHASLGAPRREMRIDRIVFNGTHMEVLGPTTSQQQKPEMPDMYAYFEKAEELDSWRSERATVVDGKMRLYDNGWVLTNQSFDVNYTAECNVCSITDGRAGVIFSCTDRDNYGTVAFDSSAQTLNVIFVVNGESVVYEKALVRSFDEDVDFTVPQLLTVRKYGDTYTFLVNNRTLCEYGSSLVGGAFGAFAEEEAWFGFMGITGESGQSSIKKYHKPIPGTLNAVTCAETDMKTVHSDGTDLVKLEENACLHYLIQVADDGVYDLGVSYRSDEGCILSVCQNDTEIAALHLSATDGETATHIHRGLALSGSADSITFTCKTGSTEIVGFRFTANEPVTAVRYDFIENDDAVYSDGEWKVGNGALTLCGDDPVGKRLYGSENWGDYIVEADIALGERKNFGVLLRVTDPSVGGAGNDVAAGSDFLRGYFVGLDGEKLVLGKHNYDWAELKLIPFAAKSGTVYHIKAEAVGALIKIFIDGELLIEYTDPQPFMRGMVGFRGHHSSAEVYNFKVY